MTVKFLVLAEEFDNRSVTPVSSFWLCKTHLESKNSAQLLLKDKYNIIHMHVEK